MTPKSAAPAGKPSSRSRTSPSKPPASRWGGFLRAQLVRTAFGPITNLFAAIPFGFACVALVVAWQSAPQRMVLAKRFEKLTGRAQGKIVESWMAVELDPAEVGTHTHWQPFSKASYCAVVEYSGDWGVPARRAFCGTRFPINETYVLPDESEMAPRVPFAWPRDGNRYVVPEIRLSAGALQWLASHPADFAWPNKPAPPPALAALRLVLDRPVDDVVAGWSLPVPAFPLVFDPQHPEAALPAGYVERQLDEYPGPGNWIGVAVAAAIGLFVWFETMGFIFGNLGRWGFWTLAILPLATVPWWGEVGPRLVGRLNQHMGDVVEMMVNDVTKIERLVACAPADAILARGERLVWRAGEGAHAETFWRFAAHAGISPTPLASLPALTGPPPGKPTATPAPTAAAKAAIKEALAQSSDAALAALAETFSKQVRALGAEERTELFARLERDKTNETLHAGIVFLLPAKEAIVDPQSPPALRKAARDFLWAWVLTPGDGPGTSLALGENLRLNRELLDVPVPEIANMAAAHWGPAQKAP